MKNIIKLLFILPTISLSISSCYTPSFSLIFNAKESENISYLDIKDNNSYEKLTESAKDFAFSFSSLIYDDYSSKYDNLVVSPATTYMGLALISAVSSSSSQEEILNTLNIDYETLKDNVDLMYRALNDDDKEKGKTILDNSIWINSDTKIKVDGFKELSEEFYVNSYRSDFLNNNKKANQDLTNYIKDKTNDLIDLDLKIDPSVYFVLLNVLYYKDLWNNEGDELSFTSKEIPFKNRNNEITNQKMLQSFYESGRVYESAKFESFFNVTTRGYTINFIKPKDNYTIDEVFTYDSLKEISEIESYNEVDEINKIKYYTRCIFPEFEGDFNENLVDFFKNNYGINDIFNFKTADFSKILESNDRGEGFISKLIHATKLKVNKKGIEGAAIFVSSLDGATDDQEPYEKIYEDFILDCSFGFYILDPYDNIIFSGVIDKI